MGNNKGTAAILSRAILSKAILSRGMAMRRKGMVEEGICNNRDPKDLAWAV